MQSSLSSHRADMSSVKEEEKRGVGQRAAALATLSLAETADTPAADATTTAAIGADVDLYVNTPEDSAANISLCNPDSEAVGQCTLRSAVESCKALLEAPTIALRAPACSEPCHPRPAFGRAVCIGAEQLAHQRHLGYHRTWQCHLTACA